MVTITKQLKDAIDASRTSPSKQDWEWSDQLDIPSDRAGAAFIQPYGGREDVFQDLGELESSGWITFRERAGIIVQDRRTAAFELRDDVFDVGLDDTAAGIAAFGAAQARIEAQNEFLRRQAAEPAPMGGSNAACLAPTAGAGSDPLGGEWRDSNNNGGIRLEVGGVGKFNTLTFFATDVADVGGNFSIKVGNTLYSDLAGAGGSLANGNIHLVRILLDDGVENLTVELMHDRINDGFGIDGSAPRAGPVNASSIVFVLTDVADVGARLSQVGDTELATHADETEGFIFCDSPDGPAATTDHSTDLFQSLVLAGDDDFFGARSTGAFVGSAGNDAHLRYEGFRFDDGGGGHRWAAVDFFEL